MIKAEGKKWWWWFCQLVDDDTAYIFRELWCDLGVRACCALSMHDSFWHHNRAMILVGVRLSSAISDYNMEKSMKTSRKFDFSLTFWWNCVCFVFLFFIIFYFQKHSNFSNCQSKVLVVFVRACGQTKSHSHINTYTELQCRARLPWNVDVCIRISFFSFFHSSFSSRLFLHFRVALIHI